MHKEFVKGPISKEDNLNWLAAKFQKLPKERQEVLFRYLRIDLQYHLRKSKIFAQ